MRELVFFLEEESAKAMLNSLLPRVLDPSIRYRLIPFEGKRDLELRLETKLRRYINPSARFIVMCDQDGSQNCIAIKQRLLDSCAKAFRQNDTLVRIACRELEAFYLADLAAVEQATGIKGIAAQQNKAKFRMPDTLQRPSQELYQLTSKQYQKVGDSARIGHLLDITNNRSNSFACLISGIKCLEQQLLAIPCEEA